MNKACKSIVNEYRKSCKKAGIVFGQRAGAITTAEKESFTEYIEALVDYAKSRPVTQKHREFIRQMLLHLRPCAQLRQKFFYQCVQPYDPLDDNANGRAHAHARILYNKALNEYTALWRSNLETVKCAEKAVKEAVVVDQEVVVDAPRKPRATSKKKVKGKKQTINDMSLSSLNEILDEVISTNESIENARMELETVHSKLLDFVEFKDNTAVINLAGTIEVEYDTLFLLVHYSNRIPNVFVHLVTVLSALSKTEDSIKAQIHVLRFLRILHDYPMLIRAMGVMGENTESLLVSMVFMKTGVEEIRVMNELLKVCPTTFSILCGLSEERQVGDKKVIVNLIVDLLVWKGNQRDIYLRTQASVMELLDNGIQLTKETVNVSETGDFEVRKDARLLLPGFGLAWTQLNKFGFLIPMKENQYDIDSLSKDYHYLRQDLFVCEHFSTRILKDTYTNTLFGWTDVVMNYRIQAASPREAFTIGEIFQ